jgi:aldehyde dehydrogenase (NAD+)
MTDILEKARDALPGAPKTHQLFIAGEWVDSVSGETFESVNPADRRDVIGRFQAGTKADTAMAIRSAEMALPRW